MGDAKAWTAIAKLTHEEAGADEGFGEYSRMLIMQRRPANPAGVDGIAVGLNHDQLRKYGPQLRLCIDGSVAKTCSARWASALSSPPMSR